MHILLSRKTQEDGGIKTSYQAALCSDAAEENIALGLWGTEKFQIMPEVTDDLSMQKARGKCCIPKKLTCGEYEDRLKEVLNMRSFPSMPYGEIFLFY